MLNRALFDRITLEDDDTATITPKQAIATILASDPSPHNEQTLSRVDAGQGLNVRLYVEVRGLEPLTPCMPCKCATSCAIPPHSADQTAESNLYSLIDIFCSNQIARQEAHPIRHFP